MHAYVCVFVVYVYVRMCACVYVRKCVYVYVCMYVYVFICACVYIYDYPTPDFEYIFAPRTGLLRDGKTTTWEGGVREPGIVHWPGHVPAGRVSPAVVATYDIFPTALALAGVDPPSGVHIDGRDMAPVIFGGSDKSQHDCIFHYKGTPGLGCPKSHPTGCPGLWAIRCGAYKLHTVTSNWTSGPCLPQLQRAYSNPDHSRCIH